MNISEIKSCEDLGLPLCHVCKNNDLSCYIFLFYKNLKSIYNKEQFKDFLKFFFEFNNNLYNNSYRSYRIFYLQKTIEIYFPQYKSILDKYLLLK